MTFNDLSGEDIAFLTKTYQKDLPHKERIKEATEEFEVAGRTIRSWWQRLGLTSTPSKKQAPKTDDEGDLVTEEYEQTPYDTLVLKSVWQTQGPGGVTKTLRSWKNNITGQDIQRFRDELIEQIKDYAPPDSKIDIQEDKEGQLAVISFPDYHIGRKGVEESSQIYKQAIEKTISRIQGKKLNKILYVVGNDWLNVDIPYATTKGTPQKDVDDFSTTMRAGVQIALDSIERLKTLGLPIDVIVLSGNHDRFRTEVLGIALAAYFRNDTQVDIDDSRSYRKYYTWAKGRVAFMLEHGELKLNDYPQVFAAEEPKIWGNANWRFALLGHLHHNHEKELRGIEVKYLPSLADNSDWETSKAYMSHQRGFVFIFDKEEGETDRLQIKI